MLKVYVNLMLIYDRLYMCAILYNIMQRDGLKDGLKYAEILEQLRCSKTDQT